MSDRCPVSNEQRSNANNRQLQLQQPSVKIGHSVSFRGARVNIGPNQTGYDHMYATDTEDGQPQAQRQQVALTCVNSASGPGGSDTVTSTTAVSEVHFLKEFLIIHLDLIEQQNEDILQKDNTIINLQQENALLKQRIKALEQHNSGGTHLPLTTLIHNTLIIPPTDLPPDTQQQTAPGDYSPESIPPTEDVLAPDVGDEMTLAEPVAPLSAIVIRNNVTLPTTQTLSPTIQQPVDLHQQPVVANANDLGGACLPEACVEEKSLSQLSSVVNCETKKPSEVVLIEDDKTNAVVKPRTELLPQSASVVEIVEQAIIASADITASPQPFPARTEELPTVTPSTTTDHIASKASANATAITPPTPVTTTTARYSVVRSSVDSGESNAKNLRMSIRRKRLCSESSNTDNAIASEEGRDNNEAKARDSITEIVRGKECSRSKRKCINGQILTFPQEYVTLVGETNVNILRQQALAEEVIKAVNLEVPHWRVKVYADSYHLEGTENLDDEVFLKRHSRLENDERRRKRWDVQRIREQRIVDKLKQRQSKGHHLNSDHTSTNGGADGRPDSLDGYDTPASLWPAPEYDLQYIEVTDQLPVGAFGVPLPAITPAEFSIPWLGSEKSHSEFSGEVEPVVAEPTAVTVKSNNVRKSGGGRKSGRESSGGGATTKRRSRR